MVKINELVGNVLNTLYLEDLPSNYNNNIALEAEYEIKKLDTSIVRVYALSDPNLPYNWRQENCLVLKVKHLAFSYYMTLSDNNIFVVVDEVAKRKGNGYEILTENAHAINKEQLYEKIMLSISKIVKQELNKMRVQRKG